MLALALNRDLEGMKLTRRFVDRQGFSFNDRVAGANAFAHGGDDVGEHLGQTLEIAREDLDLARAQVELTTEAIKLRFDRTASEPPDDRFGIGQALGHHRSEEPTSDLQS